MPLRSVLALLLTFALAASAEARSLRVLSYNIHHSEGRDGEFDLGRIASIINAAKPDIVALQELDQGNRRSGSNVFQLNELAELTEMQGYFGKTINYMGGAYGNGVLVAPWLDIVSRQNHALPSPDGGEARRVIQMGLSFDADPRTAEFTFFATHLDATNATNRNAQASFINNLVAGSSAPALLAGDMNARPASETFRILDQQWTDATNIANPGISRTSQIDYIFYRGNQWRLEQAGRFIVNPLTQVASDHYPLLAVIDLPYQNADFDGDYDVDGADFLLWQRNSGRAGLQSQGDANEDGRVDSADFAVWRSQFGTPRPRPFGATAIPEPSCSSLALAAAGSYGIIIRRKRKATLAATRPSQRP